MALCEERESGCVKVLRLLPEDVSMIGDQIQFLCDSSTVVDAVNGVTPMYVKFVAPAFKTIHNWLEKWSMEDMGFAGTSHNPVEWRPRELNKWADALANEAMDRRESFIRWEDEERGLGGDAGFGLHGWRGET